MTRHLIVGTAVCPVGSLRADQDGDSLRSNLLDDGRVYNIFTGYSHPIPDNCRRVFSQPQGIRNLVAALINSDDVDAETFALTHVSNQLDDRDASEVGASLAAHGLDASVLDVTRVVLRCGPLQTLTISYDGSVQSVLDSTPSDSCSEGVAAIEGAKQAGAPASVCLAAAKIAEAGFQLTGSDLRSSMRHMIFRKGDVGANIHIELSWIV